MAWTHQDVAVLVRARGVVGEGGRARGDALAHGEGVERLPLHALCVKTVDLVQHVAVLVLAPEDPQVPACASRKRRELIKPRRSKRRRTRLSFNRL